MTKLTAITDTKMSLNISNELLGETQEHLHSLSDTIAIHKAMLPAFKALSLAAKTAGIEIAIASGFRSFERQLLIWNNKFSGKTPIKDNQGNNINPKNLSEEALIHAILLFSALPGASRHHWGCDIDVYASNLLAKNYQLQLEPWEYTEQGPLAKLSNWLNEHANEFGFYLPYASYQGGVAAEPWHLSYAPLAQNYQEHFDKEALKKLLLQSPILGKQIIIENLDLIIKRYINNVNAIPSNCLLSRLHIEK